MMCECMSCSRIRPTTPVWEDSPQSSHDVVVALCCCVQRQLSWRQFHTHGSSQCPSYWCQGSLFPIILQIQTKKQGGQQWCLLSGINFYGLYLSAPTLALSILFANFLHFSSVPRFSIFHYSFDGLAPLLLVPSSCAAIAHWLKFVFLVLCIWCHLLLSESTRHV